MRQLTVIVVEDELAYIFALRRMLEYADYRAFFAEDVEGAEKLMNEIRADILITDINMPRSADGECVRDGGIEVAKIFNAKNPDAQIIFCATLKPCCYQSGRELEFEYEYLSKPFVDAQLYLKLGRHDLVEC